MNNNHEVRVTRHSLDRVTDWLKDEMPQQTKNHLINFVAKIGLAVLVAGVLYALMLYFVMRLSIGATEGGFWLLLAPLVPLAIAFVFQAFVHRHTHGRMLVRGERVDFVDDSSLITDDDSGMNPLRWLLFPAWIFISSFESLGYAAVLRRANPALCAEILAGLAAADRRAPMAEVEMQYDDENLPQTIRGLLALPGVIVGNREYPCLMLSNELGESVRAML